jgi:anti-sigma B factor antagonist
MTNMNRTVAKPMHIDVHKNGNVTVVMPQGPRLDAEVAGDLRSTLLQLIDGGDRRLILDLPDVSFIDSSGLGALVSALKRLKQVDPAGDIRLAHVQPSVMAVLEIIRLHRVFSQFPSVDAAVNSFRATV